MYSYFRVLRCRLFYSTRSWVLPDDGDVQRLRGRLHEVRHLRRIRLCTFRIRCRQPMLLRHLPWLMKWWCWFEFLSWKMFKIAWSEWVVRANSIRAFIDESVVCWHTGRHTSLPSCFRCILKHSSTTYFYCKDTGFWARAWKWGRSSANSLKTEFLIWKCFASPQKASRNNNFRTKHDVVQSCVWLVNNKLYVIVYVHSSNVLK